MIISGAYENEISVSDSGLFSCILSRAQNGWPSKKYHWDDLPEGINIPIKAVKEDPKGLKGEELHWNSWKVWEI